MARKHLYDNTTIKDLATIRPFGVNEYAKLLPYSYEVESEWVLPALTVAFFSAVCEDKETYKELFEGGMYDNDTRAFEGLQATMAYLTLSRFLRNKNAVVSASGIVIKDMPFSASESEENIVRMANESQQIGLKYLRNCRDYCEYKGYITQEKDACGNEVKDKTKSRKNFKIIGD